MGAQSQWQSRPPRCGLVCRDGQGQRVAGLVACFEDGLPVKVDRPPHPDQVSDRGDHRSSGAEFSPRLGYPRQPAPVRLVSGGQGPRRGFGYTWLQRTWYLWWWRGYSGDFAWYTSGSGVCLRDESEALGIPVAEPGIPERTVSPQRWDVDPTPPRCEEEDRL